MDTNLAFVTCCSNPETLHRYLLRSPCLVSGCYQHVIYMQSQSAAAAFNHALQLYYQVKWLVWVHQDVYLPQGWDLQFLSSLSRGEQQFPRLAVAGVYGVRGVKEQAVRAGHLLDRGEVLREPATLPCLVDSLDELLFAVRTDSGLRLDPALGFDFYATDLVLVARQQGFQAAVVEGYCEHWSGTPRSGEIPQQVLRRVADSGAVFEQKWAACLPLETPCFSIGKPGDLAAACYSYGLQTL